MRRKDRQSPFDSDSVTNYSVQLAEWELAKHLETLGAEVKVVRIIEGAEDE